MELRVLAIDDDKESHMAAFIAKARKKKIAIDHLKNYEDGLKKLSENYHNYDGVILDARCFPDKENEEKNLTSDDHVDGRIQEVRKLTEKYAHIPHCVFTGYGADFKKRLENAGFKVFSKGLENNEVIDFIIEGNKLERKYFAEHPEIMSLFQNKYLNKSYLTDICKCLDRIDHHFHRFEDVEKTATTIRKVMEGLYDSLAVLEVLPKGLKINSERSRYLVGKLKDSNGRYIDDKFKAPNHIGWGLTMIHDASSNYLHHGRTIKTKDQSIYLQQSMIYSLFEVLLWFHRDIMETHFKT